MPGLARFRNLCGRKTQDEITHTLVKDFNWDAAPSAGQIPGMIIELH